VSELFYAIRLEAAYRWDSEYIFELDYAEGRSNIKLLTRSSWFKSAWAQGVRRAA
jgi:hypothetical protein